MQPQTEGVEGEWRGASVEKRPTSKNCMLSARSPPLTLSLSLPLFVCTRMYVRTPHIDERYYININNSRCEIFLLCSRRYSKLTSRRGGIGTTTDRGGGGRVGSISAVQRYIGNQAGEYFFIPLPLYDYKAAQRLGTDCQFS